MTVDRERARPGGDITTGSGISPAALAALHPRLYYVAAAGAWESMSRFGLLTTEHLVHSSGLPEGDQDALLTAPRRATTMISHPAYGPVAIRDQTPLRLDLLPSRLEGISLAGWLQLLNNRVFFWTTLERALGLLGARRSRTEAHDVIVVDTASLLTHHGSEVRLSAINSGAVLYPNAPTLAASTFCTLEHFPYEQLRRIRAACNVVTEVAVLGGVSDLARHVQFVDRYTGPSREDRLYTRAVGGEAADWP